MVWIQWKHTDGSIYGIRYQLFSWKTKHHQCFHQESVAENLSKNELSKKAGPTNMNGKIPLTFGETSVFFIVFLLHAEDEVVISSKMLAKEW